MPLSKKRNRERMRAIRLHKATSTPQPSKAVQPKGVLTLDNLKKALDILKKEGVDFNAKPIPMYNPMIHRAGDTVLINGKVVTIPSMDADGQPVYE